MGLAISAFNLVALCWSHTAHGWLAPRPALAVCLLFVPHMAAVLLLIALNRRSYATWRKPLGSAATLHTAINVRFLGPLRIGQSLKHSANA